MNRGINQALLKQLLAGLKRDDMNVDEQKGAYEGFFPCSNRKEGLEKYKMLFGLDLWFAQREI